jgi:redox-sensitive bicupin YhaK (pirin superfamily)
MARRRTFLKRIGLGLFSMPLISWNVNSDGKEPQMNKKILQIKPLGFQWETQDPFLFCVHHEDLYPKGNEHMGPDTSLSGRYLGQDFIVKDGFRMYHGTEVPGFPGHPHRGFETITVVREGLVDHADSTGACGRYGNGDVQWMTAGKGVQHSEMFPCLHVDKDNPLELFQIWLNLPAKSKMVEPHFKMLWSEQVPKKTFTDNNGNKAHLEVLVGKFENLTAATAPPDSWAATESNEVAVWNIRLDAQATFVLPVAGSGINRTVYFYFGNDLQIEDVSIPHYHAVTVDASRELCLNNSGETAKILVLQGKPINQPVVQHGPFVMNTKDEIYQAFADYQRTQFGGWPWPKNDQVHDRDLGRFALHSDGKEEVKG